MRCLIVFMLVDVTIAKYLSEPDELKRFRRSENLLDSDHVSDSDVSYTISATTKARSRNNGNKSRDHEWSRDRSTKSTEGARSRARSTTSRGHEWSRARSTMSKDSRTKIRGDGWSRGSYTRKRRQEIKNNEVTRNVCTTFSCELGKICAVEECVDAGLQCGQELCAEGVSCNDNRCEGTRCGIVDCEDGRDCQLSMCNGPGIICGNTNCSSYERCFKGVCYDRSCKEPYCVSHPREGRLTTSTSYTINIDMRPKDKDNPGSKPLSGTNVDGLETSRPRSRASKIDENNTKKISKQEEITNEVGVCNKTRCEMLGRMCLLYICKTKASECAGVSCDNGHICFNNTCTTSASFEDTELSTGVMCMVFDQGESCGSGHCPIYNKCVNNVCRGRCNNHACQYGTCDTVTDTCNVPCKTAADCSERQCIDGTCSAEACGESICG